MWCPNAVRSVAEQWARDLFTDLNWQRDPNRQFNSGESAGFLAFAENFSHAGYVKPTRITRDDHTRAANEKIVSDIAAKLGLPVPPVLLYRRNNCPPDHEINTCVGLVMYPEHHGLDEVLVLSSYAQTIKPSLTNTCGIIALDAYVGNTDRGNRTNTVYGVNKDYPADDSFVYLDFANSMNFNNNRWANGGWKNVSIESSLQELLDAADPAILSSSVKMIEELDEAFICEAVTRIPDDYMKASHKQTIVEGLIERRRLVRVAIATRFQI